MAIVTLTTDFGLSDGYVGAMKGVLLSAAPLATIVDISHAVPGGDVPWGARVIAQAAPLFPPGTIHVGVVDPGVGSDRAAIIVEAYEQFFVGPDNGLFSLAASGPRRIVSITAAHFRREPVSATFQGRDVFARAAGLLAAGERWDAAGPAVDAMLDLKQPSFELLDGKTIGVVVHVDHFGNLFTSIPATEVPSRGEVSWRTAVSPSQWTAPIGRTFSDVRPGALVAYVGSSGLLEIGLRDGSAAAKTGAGRGTAIELYGGETGKAGESGDGADSGEANR